MDGSAAVIGTMMLPILGYRRRPTARPRARARQLGLAFQLTNFLRDVGEDLDRGRVYLPEEDLTKYDVTRERLAADIARGRAGTEVRDLIEYEAERAREHYRAALPGVELLEPRSRVCIRAAMLLYGAILDEIAANGYDVLGTRAVVRPARRAAIVGAAVSGTAFARLVRQWRIV